VAAKIVDDGEDAGGIVAEINITPLTDVFLVLLIIFMVTSSVIANTGKKVDLPEAQQTSQTPNKAVNVTLTADDQVQLNGKPIRLEDLQTAIKAALVDAEDKMVILRGDKNVILDRAVYVLDQAQLAGAQGFAIATTRTKKR